jgi:hypothetical protein
MIWHTPSVWIFCAVVAVAGCSSQESLPVVEGAVTLDGQPLESGLIRFVPVDGLTPTADATITGGKYSAQVPAGEKQVSISAPKVVGQQKMYDTPDSPTADIVDELLPAKYNAKTELVFKVVPGTQTRDFALLSK